MGNLIDAPIGIRDKDSIKVRARKESVDNPLPVIHKLLRDVEIRKNRFKIHRCAVCQTYKDGNACKQEEKESAVEGEVAF